MEDPRNWDFSLGEDKEEVSARSRWFFCYDRLELDEASTVTGIYGRDWRYGYLGFRSTQYNITLLG